MKPFGQGLAIAGLSLLALVAAGPADAQKSGGVLKIQHFDSPASMSILEESTRAALQPMMAVFNNLVIYDQNVKQNSLDSIVPDLATSWNWSEDGKELTFKLRDGVKWHDGKPFTAADVKCTWDLLMGTGQDKLRVNPRKSWYHNLESVTHERRFRGHVPPEAAAAGAARAARLGLVADLSVPRAGARDAAAPDRHRSVQVRRVQAERIHQGHKEPGLLEEGPALSRRHRFHDHARDRAAQPRLLRRRVRCRLALRRDPADARGLQGAGAERDLRDGPRSTCRARC